MQKIIGQGAEAIIMRKDDIVIKDRIAKRYRHPALDTQLREQRTKYEERLLKKASKEIPVPKVINADVAVLEIEFIDGPLVKELLDGKPELAEEIGTNLAKIHQKNIIHGDLTTSNMIMRGAAGHPEGGDPRPATASRAKPDSVAGDAPHIVFIDFGLAFTSARDEDKAVDIHLFRQALESKHHRVFDNAYNRFLKGYRAGFGEKNKKACEAIIDRLRVVEARGRNKTKF